MATRVVREVDNNIMIVDYTVYVLVQSVTSIRRIKRSHKFRPIIVRRVVSSPPTRGREVESSVASSTLTTFEESDIFSTWAILIPT